MLGLRPGQRVLEVGPGPGKLLVPAARLVLPDGEAVGLELQPGMARRLAARAERLARDVLLSQHSSRRQCSLEGQMD